MLKIELTARGKAAAALLDRRTDGWELLKKALDGVKRSDRLH